MPLSVKPIDLKAIAKVSGGVKDVTAAGGKRNYWNSVHRLLATPNKLKLFTTDNTLWLEWVIPVAGPHEENWDILLPAAQFNEMAAKSAEGGLYELFRENNLLHLHQGQRNLRIREETPQEYQSPIDGENKVTWTMKAETLGKALRFVTPFIDAMNPTVTKSVATLSKEGLLIGGAPKRVARVEGITGALESMSFKQKTAKAVATFLSLLTDDVKITVDSLHYTFESPLLGHRLVVAGENVVFPPMFHRLENKETEVMKFDGKMLVSGVSILSALLPADADRLNLKIRGSGENSSLRLSTAGDDQRNSNDEFPILRNLVQFNSSTGKMENVISEGPPEETLIAVNCRIFQEVLNQMEGTTLSVKYYQRMKFLYIEDEKTGEDDIVRSLLLTVQHIGAGEETLETPPETSSENGQPVSELTEAVSTLEEEATVEP